jgi:hypothetical protein
MKMIVRVCRTLSVAAICLAFTTCALTGKKAYVSILNPQNIYDLCVTINTDDQKQAQTVPYTYSAREGETVSITAFTSTGNVAAGSVTTRITNDCESEITYSAEIRYGQISVYDNYTEVQDCSKDKNKDATID